MNSKRELVISEMARRLAGTNRSGFPQVARLLTERWLFSRVCHIVDDVTQARRWYRDNGSTQDLHARIAAQKMLHSAMSGIGFDPAGRSSSAWRRTARHGPALEDLISRRAR